MAVHMLYKGGARCCHKTQSTFKYIFRFMYLILIHFFFFFYPVPIATNGVHSLEINFERPPSILVPLKVHTPPNGYQLFMTCAVRGCPTPNVSWFLNDVCINSDNHYYMTNSFGVCSLYILRVRPKDSGEYKVLAVNSSGQAECATKLVVKGKIHIVFPERQLH